MKHPYRCLERMAMLSDCLYWGRARPATISASRISCNPAPPATCSRAVCTSTQCADHEALGCRPIFERAVTWHHGKLLPPPRNTFTALSTWILHGWLVGIIMLVPKHPWLLLDNWSNGSVICWYSCWQCGRRASHAWEEVSYHRAKYSKRCFRQVTKLSSGWWTGTCYFSPGTDGPQFVPVEASTGWYSKTECWGCWNNPVF